MKSTKITWASALGVAVLSLTAFNVAAAQTTTLELADILNADIDQTVELDTNMTHPLGPLLEGMAESFDMGGTMTEDQMLALKNLLAANKMTFAMKNVWVTSNGYSYPEPNTYVSFHATLEDLAKIGSTTTENTEMIQGIRVDIPDGETGGKFIGYFGDLVVITNSRENMNTLITNFNTRTTTAITLGKNPDYIEVKSKALPNSFLNMYINPAQLNMPEPSTVIDSAQSFDLTDMMGLQKEFMEALKGEGVSVAQTLTGFDYSIFVKGDAAKLSTLNLQFNRYNFVAELFRYVNSSNLIMYGEESNFEGKMKDLMKVFADDSQTVQDFTAWKNELKADANIDFDTEILPLLRGKYALSLHKTDQIWPAVTLIVDVRDANDGRVGVMAQNAGSMLTRLIVYADKIFGVMEAEEGVDFYNRDIATYTNQSFYRLTFDPTVFPDTDEELKNLPREKVIITIQTGVTQDGFLVVTTAPNMNDTFTRDGKGLMNNATFTQAYKPNESVAGIGFLSMDNLQDYVGILMDTFAAPDEARIFINGILDPWHDSYLAGYATADSAWVNGFMNVDVEGLARYQELFETAFGQTFDEEDVGFGEESDPGFEIVPAQFCDVHDSDWFAPFVEELAQNQIISGYSDGCFRPGNAITRAEFLKMAIEVMTNVGLMSYESVNFDIPSSGFSDVHTGDWYAHYVDQGVHLGWVNGYSDNTFRPNDLITRAEALQMLYNMSGLLKRVDTSSTFDVFMDVHANDWFIRAINAAYAKGIVSGVTDNTFEPVRNLNRAEAAKMIKLFLDLEVMEKDEIMNQ